ncbi:terminase large subunit [Phenylobacterium sp.]|uniref:terminase large subunit n=1 Tax=Phenylobacterium sp. TaxID=1871053 RepID=UPI00301CFC2A
MAAARKWAEPERPACFAKYPGATWDSEAGVWRDGDFWFDARAAQAASEFFPKYLCLTEGEWAGRPFVLQPWQEHDVVRPLFGWKRADGTRRYRRCFIWIPRKNGKTEFAAGLMLLMLLGDAEPGGQVFSIAAEKDQASIVFNKATTMVAYSQALGELLETLKTSIYCPKLNASIRPLSGKPHGKHGLNMSGLVGDEIHEWKSGDLYTFVHDSAAARRQPLEILISTAGVKGTYGEEVWDECQAIVAGEVDAPDTLVVIYAANDNDDWTDPEVHKRANPNFAVSVKVDAFNTDLKRARQLPRYENDFKRYRLNLWTEQAVRWLPMDAVDDDGRRFGWDHCVGATPWRELERRLIGKKCYGGLDLAAVNDLSALVWWFPIQDGLARPVMLPRFFKPSALIKEHSRRDKIRYDRMADTEGRYAESGSLIATPGNVADYPAIRAHILADGAKFKIAWAGSAESEVPQHTGSIAIDRWNAIETTVKLREEGLAACLFGQGFASMSAPAKELERLVLDNGFDHGGHPLLREHAKAVAIETDAADNIKPSKSASTRRIDGIVGGVMALGIALPDPGEPEESVYEKLARQRREAAEREAA